jgi:hypothetical protein
MQLVRSSKSAGSSPYCERQSSMAEEYWPSHSSPHVARLLDGVNVPSISRVQPMRTELRKRPCFKANPQPIMAATPKMMTSHNTLAENRSSHSPHRGDFHRTNSSATTPTRAQCIGTTQLERVPVMPSRARTASCMTGTSYRRASRKSHEGMNSRSQARSSCRDRVLAPARGGPDTRALHRWSRYRKTGPSRRSIRGGAG